MWCCIQYRVGTSYGLIITYKLNLFLFFFRMFFVLHANVCGTSVPHHGHSHGGGGHAHGGSDHGGHAHGGSDHGGHAHGGNHHGHSHGDTHHGHSHENSDNHNHSDDDETPETTDTIINADPLVADIVTGQTREQVIKKKKKSKNLNVQAAIIHVIGDFVQSVGVLCAAILIHFKV